MTAVVEAIDGPITAGEPLVNALFAPYVPAVPTVGRWRPARPLAELLRSVDGPGATDVAHEVVRRVGGGRTVWRVTESSDGVDQEFSWFRPRGGTLPVEHVTDVLGAVGQVVRSGIVPSDPSGLVVRVGSRSVLEVEVTAGWSAGVATPVIRRAVHPGPARITEVLTPYVVAPFNDAVGARLDDAPFGDSGPARMVDLLAGAGGATAAAVGHLPAGTSIYVIGVTSADLLGALDETGSAPHLVDVLRSCSDRMQHLALDVAVSFFWTGSVLEVREVGLMAVL